MADRTSSDSSRPVHLSVSAPAPPPISKDLQGSDNSIPLSPQWLLPKPGENKPGVGSGEYHSSPYANNFSRSDSLNSPWNGDDMHDAVKKKDVFRPSLLDMETGLHDRWHEEERDTKSSTRKDRWREGDKDASEARKVDRWTDNPSSRHFGEARRGASERWTDTGNRENNYEPRRESKWSTRWGPDDKEKEVQREKWTDAVRDGDMPLDKGLSHNSRQVKDEKDGDHYRPWRPSFAQSRGRGDPSHHPKLTPSKQASAIPYGRGRGEIASATFSQGRGRGNSGFSPPNRSSHSQSSGMVSDKGENVPGEPSPLRYNRKKLLDIYRKATRSSWKLLDGFVQVPSLTQEENEEPLALSEPTLDELVILKGIEKGDITSSGAPQVSKDGSAGRGSTDSTPLRRPNFGSKEDLHPAGDGSVDICRGGFSEGSFHEKQMQQHVSNMKTETIQDQLKHHDDKFSGEAIYGDNAPYQKAGEASANRESGIQGEASNHSGTPWRSPSMVERSRTSSHEWQENPDESRSSNADPGWSQSRKGPSGNWDEGFANSSYPRNEQRWQVSADALAERQPIGFVHRESESRKLPPPAPEDLVLCYKDPQGNVQGPFSGSDIISWFEAGYFGIDLQVRLASASNDSHFSLLGDVMPHLRAKARPPPGFNAPKQTETSDLSSMPGSSSFGMHQSGPTEIGVLKNDSRSTNGPSTDAENRFLESLMSGTQGYPGNNLSGAPVGVESGNNIYNLLAKKMALERQRSIPDPYSYWSGREVAPVVPKPDIVPDVASVHSKLLSSMSDNSRLPPQSQNTDLMSVLQGLSDRSSTGVSNGIGGWSNIPAGLGTLQDTQNFPLQAALGIQQQRLQQNQPIPSNLLAHNIDNPSSVITPEKLLSSGLSQDPHVLNMLQQQYLLQLQSQGPVPMPQLSLLDKLLLLKQQQKLEEQQQLLRQQQLLSQVLTDHQSPQLLGETSFGQLQTYAIPAGTAPFDNSRVHQSRELFQTGSNVPASNNEVDHNTNFPFLPHQISKDSSVGTETSSLHLPHQIFGSVTNEKSWGDIMQEPPNESQQKEKSPLPEIRDSQSSLKVAEQPSNDSPLLPTSLPTTEFHSSQNLGQGLQSTLRNREFLSTVASEAPTVTVDSKPVKVKSDDGAVEDQKAERNQFNEDSSAMTEVKNIEAPEAKKGAEKKSRKQRSSKSSENSKGVPKTSAQQPGKQTEAGGRKVEYSKGPEEAPTSPGNRRDANATSEVADYQGNMDVKDEWKMGEPVSSQDTQGQALQRAWKPAPGFKPKSLLEIQQEEQRREQEERVASSISMSVNAMGSSAPWSGIVANADSKTSRVSHQDMKSAESTFDKSEKSQVAKSKTSQLHDLLAEEASTKCHDREMEVSDLHITSQMEPLNAASLEDSDKFIEAKDTKKSRKKSGKSKGSAKVSTPITSSEVSFAASPIEKGKSSRQAQQENEVLPAVPSGPSLGDFVSWKGEPANPSPLPAWSTDTGKQSKTTTSLRDILKEQQKKGSSLPNQIPAPIPQRSQSSQASRGSGPSWSLSGSSPSKLASPIQINSHASTQSKYSEDDDLFWGPVDQTTKEVKQSDFPQLGNQSNWGNKSTAGRANPVGLSRQKSVGGRAAEFSLSSSPLTAQSSLKGKRDTNKQSEAMDFRDWCESESVRLTGTRDTSFLEYCLKQSRSEAEILLVENLGSYDPNHEFIDKFLNCKELLSTEVLDIAFQTRNDRKTTGFNIRDATPAGAGAPDIDRDYATVQEGSAKGGGKKKGKKGKKVSPSVLGFNVVSNRIMMGEIQTVED